MDYRKLVDHLYTEDVRDIANKAYEDVRALQVAQPELGRDRVVAAECAALRELIMGSVTTFFERNLTKHSVI